MLNLLFEILIAFLLSFKKGKTGVGVVAVFTVVVMTYAIVAIVTQSDLSR